MNFGMVYNGVSRVYELSIPDPVNSFVIPSDIAYAVLHNSGAVDLNFNFDDDGATDVFTLKSGIILPMPISVWGGKTINTDGIGGATKLQLITWG